MRSQLSVGSSLNSRLPRLATHHTPRCPKGLHLGRHACNNSQRLRQMAVQFKTSASTEVPQQDVEKAYKRLQNGSDIRGVAVHGVPGENVTLTPAACYFIGRAFALWTAQKVKQNVSAVKIAVGGDPRVSGPMLKASVAAGIVSTGAAVADFGLATTPAMFYSTVAPGYKYAGALMMTASHLPFNRNGLKFFTAEGGLEKPDISAILQLATQDSAAANILPESGYQDYGFAIQQALAADPAGIQEVDFMPVYSAFLREIIKKGVNSSEDYDRPLKGFKIVVDAGNGSGGYFPGSVLEPLGADVSGSQFLEPDGTFPNHIPNPEDKTAMAATIEAVKRTGADLGIVFDTDVDRSGVVDGDGQPINSNRMIAVMAAIALQQYPGTTIVTDSVTSNGLTTFIEKLGGKHFRYKRGYKNVIGKGVQLNAEGVNCELMMETSGHGAMKENRYLDDGAYSAVKILIEMVKRKRGGQGGIGQLLESLPEPVEAAEYRIKVKVPDFQQVQAQVLSDFHDWVVSEGPAAGWKLEEVNHEGWRVNVDQGEGRRGWLLMRSSLHDPLLVLNVESDVEGGKKAIVSRLREWLADKHFTDDIDTNSLGK